MVEIPWRRKWQPTSVFLPGKSHEQRSLAGYSSRSHRVRCNWSDLVHMVNTTCCGHQTRERWLHLWDHKYLPSFFLSFPSFLLSFSPSTNVCASDFQTLMHILGRKQPLHTEFTFSEGGRKICVWTIDTQTSHVIGVGGKENRVM